MPRKWLHKRFISMVVIFPIIVILPCCKKFVEVDPPVNQIVSTVLFASDESATEAVVGMYSDMNISNSRFSSGQLTFYAGMYADELLFYTPGPRDEFVKSQISEANHNTISTIFWERAYRLIYTANLCLEQLQLSNQLTPSLRTRLIGECKFVRAFCYFYLLNLFGDVPLVMDSDYRVNASLPREKSTIIIAQMITDLLDAKSILAEEYPTPGKVRPNKWTAAALLARVYLYKQDWVNAENEASHIINSNDYRLVPLPTVFLKSSDEAIWQLLPVNPNNNNTWEGNSILQTGTPTYYLRDTLVHSFENGDGRYIHWVQSRVFNGQTIYYPAKYKIKANSNSLEYYMVIRLAEVYLIRAEANARMNNLGDASNDINIIRRRASLPNTTAATQEEILLAIQQERKIELFAEWGHRWFDLKRTGKASELKNLKPNTWTDTDTLWPIPVGQIQANPALVQNPGY